MIRFPRPPEPDDFDSSVKPHRDALVVTDGVAQFTSAHSKVWGPFKRAVAHAQHYKCAYCEVKLSPDRWCGDVEHYRPKSKYHWLAFTWDNYLASCSGCNTGKSDRFPLAGDPPAVPTPETVGAEQPLLLHPFESADPADHLDFLGGGVAGLVIDRSDMGRETIGTCGLNRSGLLDVRRTGAAKAHSHAKQLRQVPRTPEPDDENVLRIVADIESSGRPDAPHAGMVRAIVKRHSSKSWSWIHINALRCLLLELDRADDRAEVLLRLEPMGRLESRLAPAVWRRYQSETGDPWGDVVVAATVALARDIASVPAEFGPRALAPQLGAMGAVEPHMNRQMRAHAQLSREALAAELGVRWEEWIAEHLEPPC